MAKIKICGLTRMEDLEAVNLHLPDYIGFVFARSRRQVSHHTAQALSEKLSRHIKKIGVFVNEEVSKVLETAAMCQLHVIQLHGDETDEFITTLKKQLLHSNTNYTIEIWKAIRMKDHHSIDNILALSVDGIVLDTYTEGDYGGSGKTFDWALASEVAKRNRIILAGGLSSHNVSAAIDCVKPYAVDVSSGVETEGIKDAGKIKSFIYAVRHNTY